MNRNLRHYSRIASEFDVKLLNQGQDIVNGHLQNISRAGLMVVVDRQGMDLLIPNVPVVSPKHPVVLNAEFAIPSNTHTNENIEATCDVIYVRRLSRNEFQLGMSFKDLSPANALKLNQYIDREQHSA